MQHQARNSVKCDRSPASYSTSLLGSLTRRSLCLRGLRWHTLLSGYNTQDRNCIISWYTPSHCPSEATKTPLIEVHSITPTHKMANSSSVPQGDGSDQLGNGKKQIFLNAFDMSTVGHLSPGQWKVSVNGNIDAPPMSLTYDRIPKTSPQPRGTSTTGSTLPSYSSEVASTHYFSPTRMEATIPMKVA